VGIEPGALKQLGDVEVVRHLSTGLLGRPAVEPHHCVVHNGPGGLHTQVPGRGLGLVQQAEGQGQRVLLRVQRGTGITPLQSPRYKGVQKVILCEEE
jgi:hypothetical protein